MQKKLVYDVNTQQSFPAEEIDAVLGFFIKNGFDQNTASAVAISVLSYARSNSMPVFEMLDSLKGLTDLQLKDVVYELLNSIRDKTSLIGYRIPKSYDAYETRNIVV